MSGVKGRSGRKSLSDEAKRQAIIDKAWELIGLYFNDDKISPASKMETAKAIATKDMVEKLNHSGQAPQILSVIHNYEPTRTRTSNNGNSLQPEADNRIPEAS